MRASFRVIDVDTHFQPSAETIVPYLDPDFQGRVEELEQFKNPVKFGRAGQLLSPPYRHWYRFGLRPQGGWARRKPRYLGEAGPRETEEERFQNFQGRRFPTVGVEDDDIVTRIQEMDEEGVDVQLMVSGAFGGHEETAVDVAFMRAHHRYLDQVCRMYPDRLKSMIHVTPRAVEESVQEMRDWAGSPWAVAIKPDLPVGFPIDHPDLEPIWAEAERQGLCVVHHSFSGGYPGERDLWDNPFLGRTASHPWAAMRSMAAFFGAGIMDRYPDLKYAILESGFGWLPFWGMRMTDQVDYMGYVAKDLQHTMWEYLTDGRFYAGIVLHEGERMVRMVNEMLGEHVLMFSSDYPHAESRFPDSVDIVTAWESLSKETMRKLFSENAARCFNLGAA